MSGGDKRSNNYVTKEKQKVKEVKRRGLKDKGSLKQHQRREYPKYNDRRWKYD